MTIENLRGARMPEHHCLPRSERAAAFVVVFTQHDGCGGWHHQLLIHNEESHPIAIRFCPFCGVELGLVHFVVPHGEGE